MAFPTNEAETIALFKLAQARLGWQIAHLQTAFPDAVIQNERGQQLVVEFEFDSKNFRRHGHDPAGCHLIVCWRDRWENPPVPVWALEDCAGEEAKIIRDVIGFTIPLETYLTVCKEVMERDNTIRKLKDQPKKEPEKLNISKTIQKSEEKRYIPISIPMPIQSSVKSDWILALTYFALGIGFWALHPFILSLAGNP